MKPTILFVALEDLATASSTFQPSPQIAPPSPLCPTALPYLRHNSDHYPKPMDLMTKCWFSVSLEERKFHESRILVNPIC